MALAAEVVTRAPWRVHIQKSIAKNKRLANSRYVQLATVRPDGRPANRTVVFRGFLGDDDDSLTFVTDKRSRKVVEVASNPLAEVAWYFPDTREQYRIAGSLAIIDDLHTDEKLQAARARAWGAMSDPARQQFGWPEPGLPREEDEGAFSRPVPGPQEAPLDTFCLVVLKVDEVERLMLKTNMRFLYRKLQQGEAAAAWSEESINP